MTTTDVATSVGVTDGLIGETYGSAMHRHGGVAAEPPPLEDDRDVAQAWRTVPRGEDASDAPSCPTVDLQVWLLHVRYARRRQPAVRTELFEEYRDYAASLARRLHRDRESLDDLIQVAMEGLLLSIERFDPERGVPFPALATPTILGSLKRHYRDHGWSVRVPRQVHDIAAPARDAADRLTSRLGRYPTMSEVAVELGVAEETLLAAEGATRARAVSSLDAPVGEGERRHDLIGEADASMVAAENRMALRQAMQSLSARERTVLGMYYFEERPQSEIAGLYGVSQMQVSRWLTGAIRRLRGTMGC
ncbi:MAG: sigma-70 family RNA polymerase sigma factor [Actinomycetota bacterium]|nr:sigma-70 family RNA polymerase sigma factor [Actinomycetota bacterium]